MSRWSSRLTICLGVAVTFLFIPLHSYGQTLHIDVLDVGQGDSILVRAPSGKKVLIDGGPDQTVVERLDDILPFWDRTIDAIVPTHPQSDHITGLVSVMQRYNVGEVLATPAKGQTVSYPALEHEIELLHVPQINFLRGSQIDLGDGVRLASLWPTSNTNWNAIKDLNDVAQVDRLTYHGFSALFTADAGANIDQQLESLGDNQPVTLLKVPHHGSRYGMLSDYVDQLQPLISVVSVGANNTYGHPATSALNLLGSLHSRIFRTDQNGTVSIAVDGAGISVKTAKMQYNKH